MLTWIRRLFRPTPAAAPIVARAPGPRPDLAEGSQPKPVPTAPTPPTPPDALELIGMIAGASSTAPDPTQVSELVELVRQDPMLISAMPAFPATSARILELTQHERLDLNELVRVLHWEPAAASEILRVANAAGFSRGKVDDLRAAVLVLGLGEVGAIASAVGARALFDMEARAEHDTFARLWGALHHEALVTAFTASWLGQGLHLPRYDRIFLRALLGSCGRPLALRVLARLVVSGRFRARPAPQAVLAALDELDAEIRELAMQTWELPPSLVDLVSPASAQERAVVELVQGIALLRRAPHRVTVADLVRTHAETLRLDGAWIRLITKELECASARVGAMFGTTGITLSAAAIPVAQLEAASRA
ncbi:MAG: HDOD domain-containing protein [Kofleriaceae bacterium]